MRVDRRNVLLAGGGAAASLTSALVSSSPASAQAPAVQWDKEADIVVVGAGAAGTVAAIVAKEGGGSVILLEAQPHTGGHAICSGGNVPLGGGTSIQKKWGVEDSADLVFRDLTDWSIVEPNGAPDYRYNDREIIRAYADHCAATCEFLLAHGVVFVDKAPDIRGGTSVGNSVPREMHAAVMDWPMVQTGKPADPAVRKTLSSGNGLMHPLLDAAQTIGVEILTSHKMKSITREEPTGGAVLGVAVENEGRRLTIRARKAVVLATGGSSTNVNFRRMFDPRLTEEYCGVAGMPWSEQDASGELAGMAIGASMWGFANNVLEFGDRITKPGRIGCQYGYVNLNWQPGSEVFHLARASGLKVANWQNVITVNMLGKRFYDETGKQFSRNDYHDIDPYTPDSYLNARNTRWNPENFLNAAMAGVGDGQNGGGPIWAIFDSAAVAREKWDPTPPNVDFDGGFFFKADTIGDLARMIMMKYQRVRMPPENLEETVARYNRFVDIGRDEDFEKFGPLYKIAKPPFYAAWATPVVHDTRAGLRINAKGQVIDMNGEIIPGLYCGGETAGGFSMHGVARATTQGFIAGTNAAAEPMRS
ncbi:MAG TPA: FAD-binding protein [Beijerinckiaceae bacterium]|jgi:succinate dehydrogenase/fumarate reductase flavoprotein subunit|nr:FAD-binding protein [Beijerinckiaceae bacterium]